MNVCLINYDSNLGQCGQWILCFKANDRGVSVKCRYEALEYYWLLSKVLWLRISVLIVVGQNT
ncbi:hypothetical protein AWN68_15575 [Roseivirga echinicomitans]|uniref:Uncharacterized protein n=1 Tax=Roseivirga echinicomitans TaxID=296218 RepID=A0A150XU42_9BACT|nr:hypothetical protein AWN68_15575 [Roseivirga echinicomitans]